MSLVFHWMVLNHMHLVVSKADYVRYNMSDKFKVDFYKIDSNDSSKGYLFKSPFPFIYVEVYS